MPEKSQRHLAAILFADIAGYTALMQRDEQVALEKLAQFKETLESKTAEFQGNIIQYYGDGCLVVFDSPLDAVGCAKVMQEVFRTEPEVPVRIGIHLGDVVFKEGNAFGDSVNIASRVESLGVPGAVLLSHTVKNQIKNHPEFQLASLGSFDFKNVDEPMEVFALANEGFPVPKREEMEGKLKTPAAKNEKPSFSWKKWVWAVGVAFVVLAAWLLLKNTTCGNAVAEAKFEKSIAVLPFRNESADKEETQYFCNGVMESVLNDLSQIGELRVISRQSIERYRGSDKSIAEIAEELGVAHLLEGSVQRSGSRVKINAQLIHAATDRHIWAKEFVGEMDDIFTLQGNIARDIAGALQAAIAPAEKARIERVPTVNMDAWNTYLEAHASYVSFVFGAEENDRDYRKTLALCDRALAMDSTLAEAWTLKAQTWWGRQISRELLAENFMDSVARFSRKALAFDPHSAMAHSILGRYFFETGQPESGREYLEKAVGLNPNQVESHWDLGNYYRDIGNYEKALSAYKTALKLAPNSVWSPMIFLDISGLYLDIGDLEKCESFMLKAKAMSGTPYIESQVIRRLGWLNMIQGNFDKAIKLAEEVKKIDSIAWLSAIALPYSFHDFEKSVAAYKKLEEIAPDWMNVNKHRWAYALWKSGNKKAGMEMFKQAENDNLKLTQLGRSWTGANYDLAGIYAFLGQKEKAWQYLRAFDTDGRWQWGSPYFIQVDPLFDNLRNDAEFKEMLRRVLAEKAQIRERLRRLEVEGKL